MEDKRQPAETQQINKYQRCLIRIVSDEMILATSLNT
jgi:hypothetical protein